MNDMSGGIGWSSSEEGFEDFLEESLGLIARFNFSSSLLLDGGL